MKIGILYLVSCYLAQNRNLLKCVYSGWYDCTSLLHAPTKIWKPDIRQTSKHTYDPMPWRKEKSDQISVYHDVLLQNRKLLVSNPCSRITTCSNSPVSSRLHLTGPHWIPNPHPVPNRYYTPEEYLWLREVFILSTLVFILSPLAPIYQGILKTLRYFMDAFVVCCHHTGFFFNILASKRVFYLSLLYLSFLRQDQQNLSSIQPSKCYIYSICWTPRLYHIKIPSQTQEHFSRVA